MVSKVRIVWKQTVAALLAQERLLESTFGSDSAHSPRAQQFLFSIVHVAADDDDVAAAAEQTISDGGYSPPRGLLKPENLVLQWRDARTGESSGHIYLSEVSRFEADARSSVRLRFRHRHRANLNLIRLLYNSR